MYGAKSKGILLLNFLVLIPQGGRRRKLYTIQAFENRMQRALFDDLYIRTTAPWNVTHNLFLPFLALLLLALSCRNPGGQNPCDTHFSPYAMWLWQPPGNMHSTLSPAGLCQERSYLGPLATCLISDLKGTASFLSWLCF